MESPSSQRAKIRREVYRASLKSAAFYPIGILVLAGLVAYAEAFTNRAIILLMATLGGIVVYFLILTGWAATRAQRIGSFVQKLEHVLREAAVTREGLVLIVNNRLLLRVNNTMTSPVGDTFVGAWIFADQSGFIKQPSVADFVAWHSQSHGIRILRPVGPFAEGGDEMRRFDAIRLRLESPYAQVVLFERDLGRRDAPEGSLREGVCFIQLPRWWALGDRVAANVDELAAFLVGLVQTEIDPVAEWPPASRKLRHRP